MATRPFQFAGMDESNTSRSELLPPALWHNRDDCEVDDLLFARNN